MYIKIISFMDCGYTFLGKIQIKKMYNILLIKQHSYKEINTINEIKKKESF